MNGRASAACHQKPEYQNGLWLSFAKIGRNPGRSYSSDPWNTRRRPSAWARTRSWTCRPGRLEDAGEVDVVFDVIGGEVLERSAPLVRAGGTLVTIIGPPKARPADGRAVFFVVEPDRFRLADLAERVRPGG